MSMISQVWICKETQQIEKQIAVEIAELEKLLEEIWRFKKEYCLT